VAVSAVASGLVIDLCDSCSGHNSASRECSLSEGRNARSRASPREAQSDEEPFGLPGSGGYHDAAVHNIYIRVVCDWLNAESACASVPLSLGEHGSPNW